ncbi:hypothetical protein GCM10009839_65930 [Catenulispora yoronensis]|uniref:DUF320 domain-containing protein n=1 Tax=Catenulispora yoronensis TaxID=450799 RepID=A0ABP5GPT1_9ACTN
MSMRKRIVIATVVAAAAATSAGAAFAADGGGSSGGKGTCATAKTAPGSAVTVIAHGDDCGSVGKGPGDAGKATSFSSKN